VLLVDDDDVIDVLQGAGGRHESALQLLQARLRRRPALAAVCPNDRAHAPGQRSLELREQHRSFTPSKGKKSTTAGHPRRPSGEAVATAARTVVASRLQTMDSPRTAAPARRGSSGG